ncbi:MAG: GNAT family N-acetyltransferase [Verrucomicrobiota bacterium]
MTIRPATQGDVPRIAAVVHAMEELRSVAQQSIETTTQTVSSNLERVSSSGCSAAYVAEESEGEIAGYGAVHWTPFLFLPGGEAYVTELFVRPSASGKGVGSGILETIIAEARRRGCSRVTLLNGRDGESYRRSFYTKRGWVEREHMANFILPITSGSSETVEESAPDSVPHIRRSMRK